MTLNAIPVRLSKHFLLVEFVPPVIYYALGERSRYLIDERVVRICEFLRDHFDKPVTINDWYWAGSYEESGLRLIETTTGALYSQHKYGRAADIKIEDITPAEVRQVIQRYKDVFMGMGLTTIEKDTPTWTHFDCRFTGMDEILMVNG